jgi:uncharacterized protein YuzE
MLDHNYDADVDAHYFGIKDDNGFAPLVWRTEELGRRTVHVDYDDRGNIVGIEVL